ncbi:MAG: hypothetical protein GY847_22115 [Proteobacteria bacterium]|nr:hypothetical protein [Pseudomonadota bacterium]
MMKIITVLNYLRKLEQAAADLYGWYAEIFDDIPEARDFFYDMKKQEIQHRDMIDFERRLIVGNSLEFRDVSIDKAHIRATIDVIEEHISEGIFEIREALDFAVMLEETAAETHYKTSIVQSNPSLAKLIKTLTDSDKGHIDRLKAFAKRMS